MGMFSLYRLCMPPTIALMLVSAKPQLDLTPQVSHDKPDASSMRAVAPATDFSSWSPANCTSHQPSYRQAESRSQSRIEAPSP